MTALDKLKAAVKEFEAAQSKHKKFGAQDTEPDGVFQFLLTKAVAGEGVKVPTTADGWELYSDMKGVATAARSLGAAATKCVNIILEAPIIQAGVIRGYLEGYCWRM